MQEDMRKIALKIVKWKLKSISQQWNTNASTDMNVTYVQSRWGLFLKQKGMKIIINYAQNVELRNQLNANSVLINALMQNANTAQAEALI